MASINEELNRFIKAVISYLKDYYCKMIVYGSYARGENTEKSDVDLMILVKIPPEDIWKYENKIYDIAYDILMDSGVEISPIIKNLDQFNYWCDTLPFYQNISREGIVLNVQAS